jgi:zinc/manganese transport system substrate-binding protein
MIRTEDDVRMELRHSLKVPGLPALPPLFVVLTLALAACSGGATATPSASNQASATAVAVNPSAPSPDTSKPVMNVLGTENFYADLLAEIGGVRVTATSILNDPNADPHAFESSPQTAKQVADARLVIVNGVGYDDFMQKLLGASPDQSRVVLNVQQLLGFGNDVNVHIWYDPATMPKVAAAATQALSTLEPANAGYFAANEQAYLASLQPISDQVAALKAKYAGTPIAFTENVAGYLTDAIGLDLRTPVGFMKAIEEGTDPAPADVAAERDLFTGHKVKVLLYNTQVISPTTQGIHDLAVQQNIPIVGVAETIPPEYHTYAEWQLAQLQELQRDLGG